MTGISLAVAKGVVNSSIPPVQKAGIICAGGAIGGCVYTGFLAINRLKVYKILKSEDKTPGSTDENSEYGLSNILRPGEVNISINSHNAYRYNDNNQVCYGELSETSSVFNKNTRIIKSDKVKLLDLDDNSALDILLNSINGLSNVSLLLIFFLSMQLFYKFYVGDKPSLK
jgi:hypothetical protein